MHCQGGDSSAAATARSVLYTCLDAGLRLISPFMPFISEELYQRLPRWSGQEPPSITVTRFPTGEECGGWRDCQLEQQVNTGPLLYRSVLNFCQVELVQKVVGVIRSTRADYNIPNKTRTQVHLQVFCPDTAALISRFTDTLATLAYSQQVQVTLETPPPGCAIVTVNDKVGQHSSSESLAG